MEPYDRIESLRLKTRTPKSDLGELAGAPADSTHSNKGITYDRFLKNLRSREKINMNAIDAIAKYLGVSSTWILYGVEPDKLATIGTSIEELPTVPLLGRVSAADLSESFDEWQGESLPLAKFNGNPDGRVFGLEVDGDCMQPTIMEGSYIYVDKEYDQMTLKGRVVVARVNGENTVKRYDMKSGQIQLVPDNADHSAITVSEEDDFEIIGVVFRELKNVS